MHLNMYLYIIYIYYTEMGKSRFVCEMQSFVLYYDLLIIFICISQINTNPVLNTESFAQSCV